MVRRMIEDEIRKVLIDLIRNTKDVSYRMEHQVGDLSVATTELHQTEQQQCFLFGCNLSMQTGTD